MLDKHAAAIDAYIHARDDAWNKRGAPGQPLFVVRHGEPVPHNTRRSLSRTKRLLVYVPGPVATGDIDSPAYEDNPILWLRLWSASKIASKACGYSASKRAAVVCIPLISRTSSATTLSSVLRWRALEDTMVERLSSVMENLQSIVGEKCVIIAFGTDFACRWICRALTPDALLLDTPMLCIEDLRDKPSLWHRRCLMVRSRCPIVRWWPMLGMDFPATSALFHGSPTRGSIGAAYRFADTPIRTIAEIMDLVGVRKK